MKKLILILFALMLSLSLLACNTEEVPNDNHGVTDISQNKTENVQSSMKDDQSENESTQSSANDNQDNINSSQGNTTTKKDEPLKWTEEDYVEENWQITTYSVYKQWAKYFKNIDTSSDGFRIHLDFETLSNESDGITVIYGPDTYNIQLTSDDSIKKGLDAIVVGNAWQRVFIADSNANCYGWLSASYDLVPQCSFHYAKHWVYYFEYEDLIVKKIVKILPDKMTVIGDDAKDPTRNTWSEEDLQEENWQKIYQTYMNVVKYFRDDIDTKSPNFIIERDKYTMRKYIDAYMEGSDVKFSITLSREQVQPLMELVSIGDYVLDVMDKDPYSSYDINENAPSSIRYSRHYFNNCAFHIEYKNGYVTKNCENHSKQHNGN